LNQPIDEVGQISDCFRFEAVALISVSSPNRAFVIELSLARDGIFDALRRRPIIVGIAAWVMSHHGTLSRS
jgi:hypothetical protein